MMKRAITGLLLLLGVLAPLAAADFNGKWFGDDGATYYLRHVGDELHWYSESSEQAPRSTGVFNGRVRGELIIGNWVDVPKGSSSGRGEVHLAVREAGNVLEVTRVTGGFAAKRITRAGFVAAAPLMTEKCLDFDPGRLAVRDQEGRFQLAQDDWWLFDFGKRESDAFAALKIIQQYGMNSLCYIGEPPVFRFLLTGGRAPMGQWYEEDCVRFQPSVVTVSQRKGNWVIGDSDVVLFDFGAREVEARAALAAIQKHQFTHACYLGRPKTTFQYLRR